MNNIDACNAALDKLQDDNRELEPKYANRESTGYEQPQSDSSYSSYCKIDKRTDTATLIAFDSLKHVTKEGNVEAGAILIEILEEDYWLPKKLCSNLDLAAGTVYVWTKFLKDAKSELLDMIGE